MLDLALDLAPGNILQRMHFRRRLRALKRRLGRPPVFVEFGAGTGWLSEIALAEGGTGVAYDLNPDSCEAAARRNRTAIQEGRYTVHNEPFSIETLDIPQHSADLVYSCMVLEHLDEESLHEIVTTARHACAEGGIFAAIVPAGMRYWGIEDEIAGHLRRYEPQDLTALARRETLEVRYWTGLTFPLSNLLRGLSDRLVARAESDRLGDTQEERTIASGHREVPFKTRFPGWTRWILNEATLWPFDLLQRIFGRSRRSMVLYCEWDMNPD